MKKPEIKREFVLTVHTDVIFFDFSTDKALNFLKTVADEFGTFSLFNKKSGYININQCYEMDDVVAYIECSKLSFIGR